MNSCILGYGNRVDFDNGCSMWMSVFELSSINRELTHLGVQGSCSLRQLVNNLAVGITRLVGLYAIDSLTSPPSSFALL